MPVARLRILLLVVFSAACSNSQTTPSTTAATAATQATTPAASTAFAPSISFTGGDTFVVGQAGQLNAVERPSPTTTMDVTTTATWESSNPGVATVSTTGLVNAIATGVTIVKASDAVASGTLVLSVVATTVKSLLIVGPATMPTGQTSQLTASVSTTGSRQVVTGGVVWQSSNPAVAAVTDAGILTAVSTGTATITASYQGVVGTLTVSVSDVAVTLISLYGTTTTTRGLTTQLTASATLTDGSARIVTGAAVWQSLNTDIATVSSSGLVTTLSTAGTATITATYLGMTGSVDIVVN